jgi:hypothetical protein
MQRAGEVSMRGRGGRVTRAGMRLGVAAVLSAGGIGALATSAWAQTTPCTEACEQAPSVPPTEVTTPPTEPTTPPTEPTTPPTTATPAPTTTPPTTAAPATTVVVRPVEQTPKSVPKTSTRALPARLPTTGGDSGLLAAAGVTLFGLGVVAVATTRRRPTAEES